MAIRIEDIRTYGEVAVVHFKYALNDVGKSHAQILHDEPVLAVSRIHLFYLPFLPVPHIQSGALTGVDNMVLVWVRFVHCIVKLHGSMH